MMSIVKNKGFIAVITVILLLLGYVHSDTLIWSYGGVYGREADKKYRALSEFPLEPQLEEVDNLGYSGIYIDTREYDANEYEQIKTAIKKQVWRVSYDG